MTKNEAIKLRIPARQFLAEFWSAPSMVLISVVNLKYGKITG